MVEKWPNKIFSENHEELKSHWKFKKSSSEIRNNFFLRCKTGPEYWKIMNFCDLYEIWVKLPIWINNKDQLGKDLKGSKRSDRRSFSQEGERIRSDRRSTCDRRIGIGSQILKKRIVQFSDFKKQQSLYFWRAFTTT